MSDEEKTIKPRCYECWNLAKFCTCVVDEEQAPVYSGEEDDECPEGMVLDPDDFCCEFHFMQAPWQLAMGVAVEDLVGRFSSPYRTSRQREVEIMFSSNVEQWVKSLEVE